jgi:sortase A
MTVDTAPPQGPAPRRGSASPFRVAVRTLGELMITFGVIMLLLVVYQLYWTNIQAGRAQDAEKKNLMASWVDGRPIKNGAFGIMYIQRLGRTWEKPVVEGVDLDQLAKGVGHFPKTAMPGEVGNFAVAAHRATHGEPFAYLDRIQPGDKVIVETKTNWFVYVIDAQKNPNPDHPAWKLVDPNYGEVVLPVPEQPGVKPTKKLLTLVTCNPRWGSTTRMIVYGHLMKSYPKPGVKPAELNYISQKG